MNHCSVKKDLFLSSAKILYRRWTLLLFKSNNNWTSIIGRLTKYPIQKLLARSASKPLKIISIYTFSCVTYSKQYSSMVGNTNYTLYLRSQRWTSKSCAKAVENTETIGKCFLSVIDSQFSQTYFLQG